MALIAFIFLLVEAKWKLFKFERNQKTAQKLINPPELILTTNCRGRPGEAESGLKMNLLNVLAFFALGLAVV